MKRTFLVIWFALLTFLFVLKSTYCFAGIYSPDDPSYFEVDDQGIVKPLGHSNFKVVLSEILASDPTPGRDDSQARKLRLERVAKRKQKGIDQLNAEEIAGLSADLIRLGGNQLDEALNLLQPMVNERQRSNFFVLTHLARIYEDRGEWESAFRREASAISDYPFPTQFKGLTKLQLTWYRQLERQYYLPFLRHRWNEANQKKTGVQETVDPIFPYKSAKEVKNPVQYLAENESYLPGKIASEEKEKLPPDALAIMQQLVLWNPHDPRLYWQLGEVYNATGDYTAALEIFDQCVDAPRNYSNRLLMEHRNILRDHVAQLANAEKEKREAEESQKRQRYFIVGGIVGAIVMALLFFQIRELRRRRR